MSNRLIRLSQLASTQGKQGLLPISPATCWRWVREGKLPKPFRLAPGTTVWSLDEVEKFVAGKSVEVDAPAKKMPTGKRKTADCKPQLPTGQRKGAKGRFISLKAEA